MRRSLLKLNERHLPKALRQALVLLTMLLLPSAAWGTVYTTSSYEASSSTIGTWNTDQASYSWYAAGSSEKSNDGGLKITIPTNSTLNTMLTLRKPDGSSTEYVTGIQINYSGDNKPTLHNLKVANIDIINQGESVTSQNPWTGNVSNGQFTFNSSIEWNAGQEIIIEYNDGVAYEESQKDFTITSIVVTTTESISYALWIGGTKFTSANLSSIASEKTDSVTSGSITFDPNNSVLTLNNATILSSITSGLSSLTIKLVGNNTVNSAASNGQSGDNYAIYSNNQNATLTIVRDEANADTELNLYGRYTYSIIGGFASVSYGEEGYQTYLSSPYMPAGYNTDSKQMIGYNTNGDHITSASISSAVTYPIWVYNTSTQKYTQLTVITPTYSDGSVSFDGTTLTLTNFVCTTTNENQDYVFYIGEKQKALTVNLVGTNKLYFKGFKYAELDSQAEMPTLTYKTSNDGNLEYYNGDDASEPNYWGNVTLNYENGLKFDNTKNKIWKNWPRLQIGSTYVRETVSSVDGYSNISYNDDKKTLTLSGTTIGTTGTTNTDIDVYLDDLTVKISGTNTIYGRFWGQYSENGSYAGKINFKNADFANASLIISGIGDGQGPITEFSECKLDEKIKITEAKVDGTSVNVDVVTYANGNYEDGSGNVLTEITLSYQAPQLTVAGIEPDENGVISGDGISGTVTFTPADDTVSPAQPATLTLEGATIDGYISSSIESLTVYLKGSSTINAGTGISPFQYFKATESSPSTGSLTFNSTKEDDGELTLGGNVSQEGSGQNISLSSGNYAISNTFGSKYNSSGYASKTFSYWSVEDDSSNKLIFYNTHYGISIGDYEVTKINQDMVTGSTGDFTYITDGSYLIVPNNNTLTNVYEIKSHRADLNIQISGDCTLKAIKFEEKLDEFGTPSTKTLNISRTSTSTSGINSLTIDTGTDSSEPAISGFDAVNIDEEFHYDTPATEPTGDETKVVISDEVLYDLWVGGTHISSRNKDNILNETTTTPSVVFDESERILTFTGTSVTVSTDNGSAVVSGLENLTVKFVSSTVFQKGIEVTEFYGFKAEEGKTCNITFTAAEGGSFLVVTGAENAISGFSNVTYNDGLISYMNDGGFEIKKQELQLSFDVVTDDNQKPQAISITLSPNINLVSHKIAYNIDYVDENIDNIPETEYTESIPLGKIIAGPCTVSAYTVDGENTKTNTINGYYFVYKESEITIGKGTTVDLKDYLLPAIPEEASCINNTDDTDYIRIEDSAVTGIADGTAIVNTFFEGDFIVFNQILESEDYALKINVTVKDVIGENTFASGQNYGTFFNETEAYNLPEGLTAYIITDVDEKTGTIESTETSVLPPNTPVLIFRTSTTDTQNYVFTKASGVEPATTMLKYTTTDKDAVEASKLYVLYNGQFVKVTAGTKILANHCYLDLSGTTAGTRGFYNIGNGEGTTAIREVKNGEVKSEKWGNGEWFDLQGRRLSAKPNKSGLYILNGKKIVIK